LGKITLAELRTLSEYEFPIVTPRTASERSGNEIAVDPKATKTGLTAATLLTQAILIILAAYFLVFQREAMLCDSFPAPGTVFRLFSRTIFSKVLFVIFAFTPAIVSGMLASYPHSTPYVQSVSIVLASSSVILSGWIVYFFLPRKRKYKDLDSILAMRICSPKLLSNATNKPAEVP
jgi:hypothetical protein